MLCHLGARLKDGMSIRRAESLKLDKAKKLIKRLIRTPNGMHFAQRVPLELYSDYLDIVKKPMWLQAVVDRIDAHAYATAGKVGTEMQGKLAS